jgi:hypothetical protein
LDIASLGNNAMPELFDHVGEHHPDQNFIFDQKYGCLAHFDAALSGDHFVPLAQFID